MFYAYFPLNRKSIVFRCARSFMTVLKVVPISFQKSLQLVTLRHKTFFSQIKFTLEGSRLKDIDTMHKNPTKELKFVFEIGLPEVHD